MSAAAGALSVRICVRLRHDLNGQIGNNIRQPIDKNNYKLQGALLFRLGFRHFLESKEKEADIETKDLRGRRKIRRSRPRIFGDTINGSRRARRADGVGRRSSPPPSRAVIDGGPGDLLAGRQHEGAEDIRSAKYDSLTITITARPRG